MVSVPQIISHRCIGVAVFFLARTNGELPPLYPPNSLVLRRMPKAGLVNGVKL